MFIIFDAYILLVAVGKMKIVVSNAARLAERSGVV